MDVDVSTRGSVAPELAQLAAEKIGALDEAVQHPLTDARVVLLEKQNPRIPLSARAEGDVRMSGHTVRARVEAESMAQAVDALADRLKQQLRRHIDRLETRRRVPADVTPGEWRRGAWTPPRPPRSWRAAGEREVVRRKSFALEPKSAVEAAANMAALDHDFFLFRDADTGADAVVYRRDDDRLGVIEPQDAPEVSAPEVSGDGSPTREPSRYSAPLDLADAISEMDALNHRFLYFTDASTGRGAVLYLRYDGHYGLIEPAA
jgi:ribosomal subunit interface protein